jgi:hypothetical protein
MANQRRSNKSRTLPGITPSGESLIGSKASQVKAALIAANNLAVSQEALRKQAVLRRPSLAQRSPILRANELTAEWLLTSFIEKLGFDFSKFEEIQAQNRAECRRILEAQQAQAIKHSAEAIATFRSAVDSRRKVIEQLVAATTTDAQISQVLLSEPFMISTSPFPGPPDFSIDQTGSEPWNSWAKFMVDSKGNGQVDVIFSFSWENSSNQNVTIDVKTWLNFNGLCRVDIPQHRFDTEEAGITLDAELSLLEWWHQPPTQPPKEVTQSTNVVHLDLYKGFWQDSVSPQGQTVSYIYELRYDGELVPPGGVLEIDVHSPISWTTSGGGGVLGDFDTGDFGLRCPFVELRIWPFVFPATGGWTVQ